MKKKIILCALSVLGIGTSIKAQVSDVSVIISPTAQYTWWDKDLSLGSTPFWGVRAGFGFGPIVELRALYEHSYNLKSDLKRINWNPAKEWAEKLENTNAEISRYGGEIKVNLWNAFRLTPYVTAGGGVMDFKYKGSTASPNDDYKESQLYGSLGAGLKINFSKRVVLSLEGKNTLFNLSLMNRYRNPSASKDKVLQNWSAGASLDFYLGGADYSDESKVGKAYRDMFSNGFRGITFVVEPGMTYIDFNDKSNFNDQYFLGGSAGVDFSPLVGLRGFYYQATQDPKTLNFKFNNDMKMYGGNLITKLNFARGIVPYLTIGGGYLDVKSQTDNLKPLKSGYFAFAGAGLEIPLFKYMSLYGNVNGMVNQQDNPDINDVMSPSDVKFNVMYQAGLKFNFGLSNRDGDKIYRREIEERLASQKEVSNKELNELRADRERMITRYEERISDLNDKLAKAALNNEKEEVERLISKKKEVENRLEQTRVEREVYDNNSSKTVKITPSQFERLVNKVVENIESKNIIKESSEKSVENSLTDLDKILLINALQNNQLNIAPLNQQNGNESTPQTNALLDKMDKILDKMDKSYDNMMTMNALQNQKVSKAAEVAAEVAAQSAIKDSYRNSAPVQDKVIVINPDNRASETIVEGSNNMKLLVSSNKYWFEGLGVIAGCSLSDTFRGHFGARAYKPINTSNFEFVPDITVNLGKSTTFGVSANLVYNLNFDKIPVVIPYVGLGIGYFSANNTGLASNVMLGAYFRNILDGRLFVEYSAHGLFSENMLSVGYRFLF